MTTEKLQALLASELEKDEGLKDRWRGEAISLLNQHRDYDHVVHLVSEMIHKSIEESATEMFSTVLGEDLGYDVGPIEVGLAKFFTELVKGLDWTELADGFVQAAGEQIQDETPCCNDFSCPCGGVARHGF